MNAEAARMFGLFQQSFRKLGHKLTLEPRTALQ
jgi:hypothetical protein